MADPAAPATIKLTLHHQVILNLMGFVACADWKTENVAMARAEIAARLALAPMTGHPQVDAVLTAAADLDRAGPDSALAIQNARAAVAAFLLVRAAQAQAAADAPTPDLPKNGADNAA